MRKARDRIATKDTPKRIFLNNQYMATKGVLIRPLFANQADLDTQLPNYIIGDTQT